MSFDVTATAYDQFMGRYSGMLAPRFADFAGIEAGANCLDVGCGPGALTAELARRTRAERVAAVDPAAQFVESCRARVPGADVRRGTAEQLPFDDASFDVALSQLVVAFMRDADAAVGELRRVVRPGGVVAVCMWAEGEQMQLLHLFWEAAAAVGVDLGASDANMRYRKRDELESLLRRGGLERVEVGQLSVESRYGSFDELWESLGTAAGLVRGFVQRLDDEQRLVLRAELLRLLDRPAAGFSLSAEAWAVRGQVL